MKVLIATIMTAASVLGQTTASSSEGPVFDSTGLLSAYQYADGRRDSYEYDPQWRMIRFTDRNGKVATFTYSANGSMNVLKPDGSG